jgi:hypothetical protein
MSLHYPKPHHNNTAEYQVSGIPYVTSSVYNEMDTDTVVRVQFPYVTQWFQVVNAGYGALRIAFTENGVNSNPNANYYDIVSGSANTGASASTTTPIPQTFHLRVKEIWIKGWPYNDENKAGFQIIAGLTNVPSGEFPTLTGSNGVEGIG